MIDGVNSAPVAPQSQLSQVQKGQNVPQSDKEQDVNQVDLTPKPEKTTSEAQVRDFTVDSIAADFSVSTEQSNRVSGVTAAQAYQSASSLLENQKQQESDNSSLALLAGGV